MTMVLKNSLPLIAVLSTFLRDPGKTRYGLEIIKEAGLPSGTIYPLLARLEDEGWLSSEWEQINEREEGRRRRRLYQLTGLGQLAAADRVSSVRRQMGLWAPDSDAAVPT